MPPASKLDAKMVAKLEAIADDGMTLKDLCSKLGIGIPTWRRWEASDSDDQHVVAFRPLAARVRAGMGSAIDDMAWGVLREVAEDPLSRPSDRLAAAQAILRLRTAHRVEVTGKDGGPLEVSIDARAALDDLLRRSAPAEE